MKRTTIFAIAVTVLSSSLCHAASSDGLGNFKLLAPPVDQRTKPTGRTGTFKHPNWTKEDPKNFPSNVAEYEIHEPDQNAYGDWAAISIGG